MSDPVDHIDRSVESDCCGAPIMSGGMCSECKEHCEPAADEMPVLTKPDIACASKILSMVINALEQVPTTIAAVTEALHDPDLDAAISLEIALHVVNERARADANEKLMQESLHRVSDYSLQMLRAASLRLELMCLRRAVSPYLSRYPDEELARLSTSKYSREEMAPAEAHMEMRLRAALAGSGVAAFESELAAVRAEAEAEKEKNRVYYDHECAMQHEINIRLEDVDCGDGTLSAEWIGGILDRLAHEERARDALAAQIAERDATVAGLRSIISDSVVALGNGSACSPDCSMDFMKHVPAEIAGCVARLKAIAAAPIAYPDTVRLDWLSNEAHDLVWNDQTPGVVRGTDGVEFYGDTLREAIDAARAKGSS